MINRTILMGLSGLEWSYRSSSITKTTWPTLKILKRRVRNLAPIGLADNSWEILDISSENSTFYSKDASEFYSTISAFVSPSFSMLKLMFDFLRYFLHLTELEIHSFSFIYQSYKVSLLKISPTPTPAMRVPSSQNMAVIMMSKGPIKRGAYF